MDDAFCALLAPLMRLPGDENWEPHMILWNIQMPRNVCSQREKSSTPKGKLVRPSHQLRQETKILCPYLSQFPCELLSRSEVTLSVRAS